MKALVVYESFWGNTEQIARAIAEGLSRTCETDVVDVADAPTGRPDADLIVAEVDRTRIWGNLLGLMVQPQEA